MVSKNRSDHIVLLVIMNDMSSSKLVTYELNIILRDNHCFNIKDDE